MNQEATGIFVSEARILELVGHEIRAQIAAMQPVILAKLMEACELVDEAGGIAMLPVKGKDPRRTFRRLMNAHGVEYVTIGKFKWWKRDAIQKLIEKHTINRKNQENRNAGTGIVLREAA